MIHIHKYPDLFAPPYFYIFMGTPDLPYLSYLKLYYSSGSGECLFEKLKGLYDLS